MREFLKIYDMYFSDTCPPTEGNRNKGEGCFNALNDYGKDPIRRTCIKCWRIAMTDILKPPKE